MAADLTTVRQNYAVAMIAKCKQVELLCAALDDLNNLYTGSGLSGTFLDTELSQAAATKHLVNGDIGTLTSNLQTIRAAVTPAILQNMGKAVGNTSS